MKPIRQLDFLGRRKLAFAFSSLLLAISLISFFVNGLSFGIDFTGGSVYEMHFNQSVDLDKMRSTLTERGFADANALKLRHHSAKIHAASAPGEAVPASRSAFRARGRASRMSWAVRPSIPFSAAARSPARPWR